MSGVAVLQFLLSANAGVTAIVPASGIFGGDAPKGSQLPLIVVEQISDTERTTVSMSETTRLVTERVQVTVLAGSYPQQKQLLALVRVACANRSGAINGVSLDSILPAGAGPDDCDVAGMVFSQPFDFLVKWRRAAS